MGTAALDFPGVSMDGVISGTTGGTIGAGLIPPPAPPVPDPSPLEAVPKAADYDADTLVAWDTFLRLFDLRRSRGF